MELTTQNKKRIESIDIVRGIIMVIMALDHVRDFFHAPANVDDPLNLSTTTPFLFFTRWITHFCAPTFVFLSGISAYLQSQRKTKKELSSFLIKRGLWLIIAELTIIGLAWTFDPLYHVFILQVIWTIGISMVILGLLVRFPIQVILIIGLIIVLGHNLLDIPESKPGFKAGFLWELLHHGFFVFYQFIPNHYLMIIYPFVPWTGLMLLGYCAGVLFTNKFSVEQRRKILLSSGFSLILFFAILRFSNFYGDPFHWTTQKNALFTFFSFIKLQKYPPSLLFMCITIGPMLILLALVEKMKNGLGKIMVVYGRTAFFYYILHFYLIHTFCAIAYFVKGTHNAAYAINSMKQLPLLFVIPGEGFGLGVVYAVWALVVLILYPLCKRYDHYKTTHKEKWWLSYL